MLFCCILRVFGKFEITILKEQTKEWIEGNFLFEKKNNKNKERKVSALIKYYLACESCAIDNRGFVSAFFVIQT